MDEKLDERLAQTEESIIHQVDEKLDVRLAQTETSILCQVDEKMDVRLAQTEESIIHRVEQSMDQRFVQTENLILQELERTRTILENKIQKVQDHVNELEEYYRIKKLEEDNARLFLKKVDELETRVQKLENGQCRFEKYIGSGSLLAAEG